MKYHAVQIKPNRERWTAFVEYSDVDRRPTKTFPNKLGFYHFPATMSKETAFNKLKKCLISEHKREIRRLQRSLLALEKLTLK